MNNDFPTDFSNNFRNTKENVQQAQQSFQQAQPQYTQQARQAYNDYTYDQTFQQAQQTQQAQQAQYCPYPQQAQQTMYNPYGYPDMMNMMSMMAAMTMNSMMNNPMFNQNNSFQHFNRFRNNEPTTPTNPNYQPSEQDIAHEYEDNPEAFMYSLSEKFRNNNTALFNRLRKKYTELNDSTFNSLFTIRLDDIKFTKPVFIEPKSKLDDFIDSVLTNQAYIPYYYLTYFNNKQEVEEYLVEESLSKESSFVENWLNLQVDGIKTYNTIIIENKGVKEANKRSLYSTLAREQNILSKVVRNDNLITRETVSIKALGKLYYDPAIKQLIDNCSKYTNLAGLVSTYEFTLPINPVDLKYANILNLVDLTKPLFNTEISNSDNVYINILLNFSSPDKTQTKSIPIERYMGSTESIKKVYKSIEEKSLSPLPYTYKDFLDLAGSDNKEVIETDFILEPIITLTGLTLIRSGGSDGNIILIIDSIIDALNKNIGLDEYVGNIGEGKEGIKIEEKKISNGKKRYVIHTSNGKIYLNPSSANFKASCFYTACKNDSNFIEGFKDTGLLTGNITDKKIFEVCKTIYPRLTRETEIDVNLATELFYRLSGRALVITDLHNQINTEIYREYQKLVDPELKASTFCLIRNHYVNFEPKDLSIFKQEDDPVEKINKSYGFDVIINVDVFFDVETVYIKRTEMHQELNKLQIYSLAFNTKSNITISDNVQSKFKKSSITLPKPLEDISINSIITDSPNSFKQINDMIISIKNKYNEQISTMNIHDTAEIDCAKVKLNFIAYNGSNFDFIPLFEYFNSLNYIPVRPILATGRLNSFLFVDKAFSLPLLRKRKTKPIIYTYSIWDPANFVKGSLDSVSKSFNIPISKGSIDHTEIQRVFEAGKFRSYIEKEGARIKEYNEKDVLVLEQLVNALMTNLTNLTGLTKDKILSSPTLPSLAWKILKEMKVYKYENVSIPYSIDTVLSSMENEYLNGEEMNTFGREMIGLPNYLDDLIRESMVAGRCSYDRIGKQNRVLNQIDVTSLYPYVCSEREYPIGDYRFIKAEEIDHDKIFFVNVRFNQQKIREKYGFYKDDKFHGYNYYPYRREDKSLDWNHTETITAFIPHVTYLDLYDEEVEMDFIPIDEEGNIGILWDNSASMFREYIQKFMTAKENEDAKPVEERNMVWRELCKLLLNGITGKVIQKKRKEKNQLYSSANTLNKDMSRLLDESRMSEIEVRGTEGNSAFIKFPIKYGKDQLAKTPAYLGVLIYAYARSYMWIFMKEASKVGNDNMGGIRYTDTDSLVVGSEFADLLDEYEFFQPRFGKFTIEEYDGLEVAGKKMYRLIDNENGVRTKNRLKGVNEKDILLDRKDNKVGIVKDNYENIFDRLIAGESVKVLSFQLEKNLPKNIWKHSNVIKTITRGSTEIEELDNILSQEFFDESDIE